MDIQSQPESAPPVAETPQVQGFSPESRGTKHHILFSLVGLFVVIIAAGAVYYWQHQKVIKLESQAKTLTAVVSSEKAQVVDRDLALKALPNIVEDAAKSPIDLIAFLGGDNTGCYKLEGSGYYKVTIQGNAFAQMQYGCTDKDGKMPSKLANILAKKVDGSWELISPTNQWQTIQGKDVPSCTMVDTNKVSKAVTPQCYEKPATAGATPTVRPVTNP